MPKPNWYVVPNLTVRPGSRFDEGNLKEFIDLIATLPTPVAIDTETNGKDVRDGSGFAVGVSIAYRHPTEGLLSHYLPFRHKYGFNLEPYWREKLKEAIEFRDAWGSGVTVFHNSKFDLESLGTLGIRINETQFTYCTMLMAHILSEEWPKGKSLNACANHWLNGESKKESVTFKLFTEKVGWENVPSEEMYEYASYDPVLTLRLFEALWPDWIKEGVDDYWKNSKRKAVDTLRNMERRGIGVDVSRCEKMSHIGRWQMQELQETLGINPASPKQLKELLLDQLGLPTLKLTKTGQDKVKKKLITLEEAKSQYPSFDKDAMEEYDELLELMDDPAAKLISQYRGWQKSVTSNYEPYVRLMGPDKRLRCNYKLHGTKTLRLSSSEPNLQNIPRETKKEWNGEMKQCFVEYDDDWELWEADYAQLEMRIGAAYGKVPSLLEIFENDRDLFTEMSIRVNMSRYNTKQLAYTMQYGGGIARIMAAFGVDERIAKEMRDQFFAGYPEFKALAQLASHRALATGRVQMWSKRYRHFRNRKEQAHKAWNAVLQGGAADIVEQRMNYLEENLDPSVAQLLLQIHDAFVIRIKKSEKHWVIPEIKRMMEAVEPDFGVKFKVDIHKWPTAA